MFAQMTRKIREEQPFHEGFILLQAARASVKVCGCGKFTCELCGFAKFHQRVRRVANSKLTTGYLSGGMEAK